MKQEKKQPGRLKMLAGYYKPYKGLFFADLFAFLGAAVTLCHSTDGSLYYEFHK